MNKHPNGFGTFNAKDVISASSATKNPGEPQRLSEEQLRKLSECVRSIPDGVQKTPYSGVLEKEAS